MIQRYLMLPDGLRDPPVPATLGLELSPAVAHAADPGVPGVVVHLGLAGLVDKVVGRLDLQPQEGGRLHAQADARLGPVLVPLPPSILCDWIVKRDFLIRIRYGS